jgi:hypothetical protein
MSDVVQLEMLHDVMLIIVALVGAFGLWAAARVSASATENAQKKILEKVIETHGVTLEKVSEVHTLTNDTATKQLARIDNLSALVAKLTNEAARKEGINIGIQQQKESAQ